MRQSLGGCAPALSADLETSCLNLALFGIGSRSDRMPFVDGLNVRLDFLLSPRLPPEEIGPLGFGGLSGLLTPWVGTWPSVQSCSTSTTSSAFQGEASKRGSAMGNSSK